MEIKITTKVLAINPNAIHLIEDLGSVIPFSVSILHLIIYLSKLQTRDDYPSYREKTTNH